MKNRYYSYIRTELVNFIPENTEKLLEIGAASGDTLIYILEKKLASEVVGVDLIEIPESNQQNKAISKFIIADLDKTKLEFPKKNFDVILAGDVFEHLKDPWKQLNELSVFLKDKGLIICSLPNFRNYKVLFNIVFRGDFKYAEKGILDKTHLRFFCKKNMINFFKTCGFEILILRSNLNYGKFKFKNLFNYLTFGIFKDFLVYQYYIVARKK